ncbi:mycothiol conjugate amidase Mca [Frigoribacterium sp. 2-23]|uniref:mycothiol conjugate amidase Mca n=1 Tax=Frigoribacterium sp. 2-23 TaxID=3415006 RepID=UPI003C6FAA35
MTLRLLAVHAHPDDESSKGAATYAYYRDRGADVLVVSCTGGEQGSILNDKLEARAHAERDIAGLRVHEMAAAQKAMGVDHLWLGYADSGLPAEGEPVALNGFATIPLETSAEPLVAIIRRFKPHVLVTYDENGGYPHPDHIRTHEVSMEAYRAAADPSRYPETGEPWQIDKVYYDRILNAARIRAMLAYVEEHDPESPLAERLGEMLEWMGSRPDLATTHVAVSDFFPARDDALRAHASQVPLDSFFFFWPNELQAAAWPTEDFQLVESHVDSPTPETDLFAGIVDDEPSAAGAGGETR